MNRRFTLLFVVALMVSATLFAQSDEQMVDEESSNVTYYSSEEYVEEDSVEVKGIHPWKEDGTYVNEEKSYCSLYLNAGFNVYDGDFTSEKKHGVYAPSVGLGFAYNFNSSWGLGFEYMFRQYKVTGADNPSTAATMLKGMHHQASAYATFDIFNCWRPQNRYKLFALNLILGGGVTWFKNSVYYPNVWHKEKDGVTISLPQRYEYHTGDGQEAQSDSKYQDRAFFLGGASFEFNVSRDIALGLRCTYQYFVKDDLDGRCRGNNNDGICDVTALLRWKINGSKKSHVYNFRSDEALEKAVLASRGLSKASHQEMAVAAVGKTPVQRDTLVVYHRDTVVMVQQLRETVTVVTGEAAPAVAPVVAPVVVANNVDTVMKEVHNNTIVMEDKYYYVYFDNGKSALTDETLKTIQQVSARMDREKDLYAVIIGYCDNTGAGELNNRLGRSRAKNVADEMALEHGISRDRMKELGRGIIRGRRSTASYAPNRRAEIQLMTYEEFVNFKAEVSKAAAGEDATPVVQTEAPKEESHAAVSTTDDNGFVPLGEVKVKDKVTVKNNDRLAKYARQYFNNTHCWVYIYEANMRKMDSPNDIRIGMRLVIPELTAEQCMITKEEASARRKWLQGK